MSEHHSDATMTESTLPEMINELNAVLVPDEELVRIREFKTMLEEVQERRDAERSKFEEIIKQLEASVSELRESSTRASAEWRSFEEHASIMKGMEDEKFDLAKKINDQEATLSMLESEIEELRRESEVMENWDIEEEVGMDRNVLALQLFRGMGFVPHHENDEASAPITSLLVRSAKRNVAASFDIDHEALHNSVQARYDLASRLWAAAN